MIGGGNNRVVETFSESPDLSDDQWHNIVLNFDRDGNCVGYVDNQNIGSIDISASDGNDISNNIDLWIGNFELNNTNRFEGLIDEVAIWSRNLTVAEINTIYDNGINGLNLLYIDNGVPEYTTWVYYILLFLSFFLIYKKLPKLRKL